MKRLLLIGLDQPEIEEIKQHVTDPIIAHEMIPRVKLCDGVLSVEKPNWLHTFVPVSHVLFHGIFEVEKDFPLISALALWNGPCMPNARGMMDARLRIPGLIPALSVTRFGAMRRGFADRYSTMSSEETMVAKSNGATGIAGKTNASLAESMKAKNQPYLSRLSKGKRYVWWCLASIHGKFA